jgi:hypothetical protein
MRCRVVTHRIADGELQWNSFHIHQASLVAKDGTPLPLDRASDDAPLPIPHKAAMTNPNNPASC